MKEKEQDVFYQEIYNDGYKKGQDDSDARFRIGRVHADNGRIADLEAIKKLYEKNEKLPEDYRRGYCEAIDRYIGVLEFSRDVDKCALRKTAEEQARIVRNRMEQRYHEAVEQGRMDLNTYSQITACIEATYQELFFAGFNVGLGELIGPQKITVNPKMKED